jgi:enoyl-CoA hydratase/carnithine racemase
MSEVLYEERGRIAVITWNRPEALNTLTHAMRIGLNETFTLAEKLADASPLALAALSDCSGVRTRSISLAQSGPRTAWN